MLAASYKRATKNYTDTRLTYFSISLLCAGGFLYVLRIPLEEALSLLHDSLEFARTFPECIIFRPTFVALRVGISADPALLAGAEY
jgi:hypothetical protein